ncbi:MAG: hypothetical protein R3B47_19235 [Bacteroidia bacterium]
MSFRSSFLRQLGQPGPATRSFAQASCSKAWISFPKVRPGHDRVQKGPESLEGSLQQAEGLKRLAFRRRGHVVHTALFFTDGGYLELDLIWAVSRKQWEFLSAKELIEAARPLQGSLRLATDEWRYAYLLGFFGLNHAPVPPKYLAEGIAFSRKSTANHGFFNQNLFSKNERPKSG